MYDQGFDNGFDTGYDLGYKSGFEKGSMVSRSAMSTEDLIMDLLSRLLPSIVFDMSLTELDVIVKELLLAAATRTYTATQVASLLIQSITNKKGSTFLCIDTVTKQANVLAKTLSMCEVIFVPGTARASEMFTAHEKLTGLMVHSKLASYEVLSDLFRTGAIREIIKHAGEVVLFDQCRDQIIEYLAENGIKLVVAKGLEHRPLVLLGRNSANLEAKLKELLSSGCTLWDISEVSENLAHKLLPIG